MRQSGPAAAAASGAAGSVPHAEDSTSPWGAAGMGGAVGDGGGGASEWATVRDGGGGAAEWDGRMAARRHEATTDECGVGEMSFREKI